MSNWQLPYTDKFIRTESNRGIDRRLPTKQIPKFKGDKTKFEYFWAAFTTIIDESHEPPKYKMIRLKACLEGKAKEAIAKLGFSADAYEEAKKTLKRKFGGDQHQIQNYLDKLRKMAPLQERNIDEVEKFTDTLVNTLAMLKDQQRWSELERNNMLYTQANAIPLLSMVNRKSQWRIVREVARLDGGGDRIPRSCVRNKGRDNWEGFQKGWSG